MRAWAIWSVKSGSVGNRIFYAWMWWFLASSQGRSSVPSSALLRVGKSRKHSVNTEVIVDSFISRSWTPHAIFLSDRNDPLWECWYNLSNLTNQRVYQELVYRNGTFKKWLQAPPPALSPVSSRFILVFALSQFGGPDNLGAWNRLRHNKYCEQQQFAVCSLGIESHR